MNASSTDQLILLWFFLMRSVFGIPAGHAQDCLSYSIKEVRHRRLCLVATAGVDPTARHVAHVDVIKLCEE